jgi:hypothetical protein
MTPDRRTVLQAFGALALLGLGAGCARIPVDSGIDSRALPGRAHPGAPYVRALPPEPGADAPEVLAGFVQAGVGSEDDFAVARAYLTEAASAGWDPTAKVTIYSGSQELQVREESEGHLVLALQAVAVLDARGIRSALAGPTPQELAVTVEEVEGQWRLSEVPDGIFLSEAAFESLYSPARLYFLDARVRHLVPDHRWVPLRRGPVAVLEGLTAGPSSFLEGAVGSRIPPAAAIGEGAIDSGTDGTAQVEVPAEIMGLPSQERQQALSQLEASLRSLRSLSGVRLVQDGQVLDLDGEGRVERALPGHRPIAAGATGVISLADASGADVPPQLVPELMGLRISSPAIAPGGGLAAAHGGDGETVLIASTDGSVPLREAATGTGYVPPRVDGAGWVWTSVGSSAGAMLALSGQGAEHDAKVDAPWLSGREVRTLDLAPDDTRMLVLSGAEGEARLELCAVVREADGTPTSLTEPTLVRTFLEDVTQICWYDETAVVMLGTAASGDELRAQVLDLSGDVEQLPTPAPGTVRLAGSVVAETVWAADADGALQRTDGEGWHGVEVLGRDPGFY